MRSLSAVVAFGLMVFAVACHDQKSSTTETASATFATPTPVPTPTPSPAPSSTPVCPVAGPSSTPAPVSSAAPKWDAPFEGNTLAAMVPDRDEDRVRIYTVNANSGALDALATNAQCEPRRLAVGKSGRDVFILHRNGVIDGHRADTSAGALTRMPDARVQLSDHAQRTLTVHPRWRVIYSGAVGVGVHAFQMDDSGRLAMVSGSPFARGAGRVLIHPGGDWAYTSGNGYEITSSGALGSSWSEALWDEAVIDPYGRYLYALRLRYSPDEHEFSAYEIDAASGRLRWLATEILDRAVPALATSPDGAYVYLFCNPNVWVYASPRQTGRLEFIQWVRTAEGASDSSLRMDPQGRGLYLIHPVGAAGPGRVEAWRVASNGGLSGFWESTSFGSYPSDLAFFRLTR